MLYDTNKPKKWVKRERVQEVALSKQTTQFQSISMSKNERERDIPWFTIVHLMYTIQAHNSEQ